MALTQLTPVENWTKIINDNYALINKLPIDGVVVTNSGIVFKNGASAQNFKCCYLQFNGFKLVTMAFDQLVCPISCNGKAIMSVSANLAPSHPVAAVCNNKSTLNNYISTDFIWWSDATTDQNNQVVSMTYIHFD